MFSILNTQFIGKVFIHLTQVDSTNNYASSLIEEGAEEGTVIFTDYQTHGRGQYDRNWQSNEGENVLCSIVLKPTFLKAEDAHKLHWMVSVAICQWLDKLGFANIGVKPPNDIYYKDRKLGGILIQNSVYKDHLQHSILGIGINVNQVKFTSELTNAVSMKQLSGRDWDLNECLSSLLLMLENNYLNFKKGSVEAMKEQYDRLLVRISNYI